MKSRYEAEEALAEMLEDLSGEGWTGEVWENLGWHYKARNGLLTVMPSIGGKYHAMLSGNPEHPNSAPGYWLDREVYDTPMEAVAGTVIKAFEFVKSRVAIIEEAMEIFGGGEC